LPTGNISNENQACEGDRPPVMLPPVPDTFWPDEPAENWPDELTEDPTEQYYPVAKLVNEIPTVPVEQVPFIHAEPWVPFHVKYRRLLFGILLVAVIVTVVILIFYLPNYLWTKTVKQIVLDVSNQTNVNDLGVPQTLAKNWILENNAKFDRTKAQDRIQIRQRYKLATLFFSTGGGNWTNKSNVLSPDNECEWYQESISCSLDKEVINITLRKWSLLLYKSCC
jgi:hypothetical protein